MLDFEFECDPNELLELLSDPDFVVDRSLAMGDLECECEVFEESGDTVVASHRQVERDLPAFLKKVFDAVQQVSVTEKWREDGEGGWQCEQAVKIKGAPLTLSADIEIFPTDDGCCYRIRQRAKSTVPLIGRRVEKFAVGQAEDGVREDMAYVEERLG